MGKLALAMTVAVLAFAAMLVQPAVAAGPVYETGGFGCVVVDANGSFVGTTDSHWIVYASGKAVLTCAASGPPSPTGKSFTVLGELCGGLDGQITTNTKRKVGRNGDIRLTCTFDGAPIPAIARAAASAVGNQ